ncbi:MAG: DUF262 domain-containing protein [Nitrosarchaeum sp.]|nr:DUF262 domain-containing protein [Nitrosarchaeum sp.]
MNTIIESENTTFGEFHEKVSKKFEIPTLQRPYTWDSNEVDKLWEDLIENEPLYYIGSIVVVKVGGSTSTDQIIDGQQRLTTLALFLISIRNYLNLKKAKKVSSLKKEISSILTGDEDGKRFIRLLFLNKNSNSIYEKLVYNEPLDESEKETQNRFLNNLENINEKLAKYTPKCELKKINILFEKIKNLQIISITCKDKSAAYKLFESINATAVTLATTDLIKNSIFESLYKNSKDLDYAEKEWNLMYERFNEKSGFLKTYIRHHWISTVGYTSHSKLFSLFLKKYKKESKVLIYSKSLFQNSSSYLALRTHSIDNLVNLPKVRNKRNQIREVLEFLSYLGVDQVYSVLLFIYNNKIEDFSKDLSRLTAFQFLYKYVPGSPSTPEKKYFANYCLGKIDSTKLFDGLFSLCEKQEVQFVKKTTDKIKFFEKKSGDVQFVLEKFLYNKGGSKKFESPTIEHIIPQNEKDEIYKKFSCDKKEINKLVNSIGNLTILEKEDNSGTGKFNQPFFDKFPLYSNELFIGNKEIANFDFKNNPQEAIKLRGEYIARELYAIFLITLKTGKWK